MEGVKGLLEADNPRRSKAERERIVKDYIQSGMTLNGYCRKHGIPASTLRTWQVKLGRDQGREQREKLSCVSKPKSFVELMPVSKSTLSDRQEEEDNTWGKNTYTAKLSLGEAITLELSWRR